jgi:hypothetical protein
MDHQKVHQEGDDMNIDEMASSIEDIAKLKQKRISEQIKALEDSVTEAQMLCATIQLSMGLKDYCRPDNHAEMPLDKYETIEESLEKLSETLQHIQSSL